MRQVCHISCPKELFNNLRVRIEGVVEKVDTMSPAANT